MPSTLSTLSLIYCLIWTRGGKVLATKDGASGGEDLHLWGGAELPAAVVQTIVCPVLVDNNIPIGCCCRHQMCLAREHVKAADRCAICPLPAQSALATVGPIPVPTGIILALARLPSAGTMAWPEGGNRGGSGSRGRGWNCEGAQA